MQALCLACGSDPKNGTEKKLGAYVMKTCFQTTTISSAMFITAMAANPLAVSHAKSLLLCNMLPASTIDCACQVMCPLDVIDLRRFEAAGEPGKGLPGLHDQLGLLGACWPGARFADSAHGEPQVYVGPLTDAS